METYGGLMVNPFQIEPEQILIGDIAHALALQCRYNGHCKYFYSIAQHSVLVAERYKDKRMSLFGLLHDAAEAYLGDLIAPLKAEIPEYTVREKQLQAKIFNRFCGGIPDAREHGLLKRTDGRLLMAEAAHLMSSSGIGWGNSAIPLPFVPEFLEPQDAERQFLQTFRHLYHGV